VRIVTIRSGDPRIEKIMRDDAAAVVQWQEFIDRVDAEFLSSGRGPHNWLPHTKVSEPNGRL
jgi:hypothetical protein